MAKDSAKRTKKDLFIRRVYELFGKHRQVLVATLDNVGSL